MTHSARLAATETRPIGAPDRWRVLVIVTLGTCTVLLDTMVNVALPAITESLAISITSLQWIITGYVLTTTSLLLGLGRLVDLIGPRRVWNAGLIALAAALLLDSLSQSLVQLVGARVLQALGATMVYAAGPALVTQRFPGASRGRALGLMTMGGQLGMAAGPTLGGWLVASFGWPAVFWARAPLALAVGVLSLVGVRESRAAGPRERFDFGGALTLGLALVALLLGVNQLGQAGPTPLALGSLLTSGLLLAAFVWLEGRLSAPMLDLRLFRNRLFTLANLTNLLSNLTMFGVWLLVPYYLVQGLGLAPLAAGLMLSVMPAVTALASPVSGGLSDRFGSWALSLAGLVVEAGALFLLARLDHQSPLPQVVGSLALLGVGLGLFTAPNSSFIMGAVPRSQLGVAGGMMTTMRSLGIVLGVAILGAVYAARVPAHQADAAPGSFVVGAFQDAFTFAGGLCLLAVALALVRGR